ncbi:hypothetical protein A6B44_06955 [Pasteurella skyensis]|uniref:Uncharacterized protein n=2 Tax=Phocoenobacter skyensis TaxID=97481 RepID=A0A1H7Z2D6_9PAST|nr:hypothetical protein A6B44_06955 [Pasteurella skyensis]SEM52351.1 hypothetical protein SAMN05444853_1224 [Pasteurella skyensis]
MNSIFELKNEINVKTSNFVLLDVITMGIYSILYLYKYTSVIERVVKKNVFHSFFIVSIAICYGVDVFCQNLVLIDFWGENHYSDLSIILNFLIFILDRVWAFKIGIALKKYALNNYNLCFSMNKFYIFLFSNYYINYCINDFCKNNVKA